MARLPVCSELREGQVSQANSVITVHTKDPAMVTLPILNSGSIPCSIYCSKERWKALLKMNARCVARGDLMNKTLDKNNTTSPVARSA